MADSATSQSPLRLLVVEDDDQVRFFVRDVMEKQAGHLIAAEASTGDEMVRLAGEHSPDCIIFDIHLPNLDGLEALRAIYQERMVAAVAITGDRADKTLKRALEEQVMAYLVKPFTAQQLIPAVHIAMARFQELRLLAEENASLKQTLQNRKIIERAKGVLMRKHRWTEPDAFRKLQRAAMNRRTTMVELAQAVLNGEDITL